MKHQEPPQKNKIHLRPSQSERETQRFREQEEKRGGRLPIAAILAIVLFFLFWGSLVLAVPYHQWVFSPAWIFETVQRRFGQLYQFLFGEETAFRITVWQYLAVMLAGAALAACGTVFQGSFRNVLAGPSTMGVMSGGSLGCLLYFLLIWDASSQVTYATASLEGPEPQSLWSVYAQQFCTLLGCFAGVALVLLVATAAGGGKLSPSAMVLSGTVFSTVTQSASTLIQYYMILRDPTDVRIELIRDLMMGSLNRVTSGTTVLMMGVPILLCLGVLVALGGKLNLLSLGEDEALTMGVNVPAFRLLMIVIGTVLTAVVVAFCGHIGFLGFMVPLIGRKLAGPDMRRLLPVSMLLGAILLVLIFDAAYITGLTGYLNLFTSSIGCIVMAATLLRRKEGGERAAFPGRDPTHLG